MDIDNPYNHISVTTLLQAVDQVNKIDSYQDGIEGRAKNGAMEKSNPYCKYGITAASAINITLLVFLLALLTMWGNNHIPRECISLCIVFDCIVVITFIFNIIIRKGYVIITGSYIVSCLSFTVFHLIKPTERFIYNFIDVIFAFAIFLQVIATVNLILWLLERNKKD